MLGKRLVFFGTILLGVLVVFVNETHSGKASFTRKSIDKLPYIVVYGHDQCLHTKVMRNKLNDHNIPFRYKNIDEQNNKSELQQKLVMAGISNSEPPTPVLDVNATILLQPPSALVIRQYQETKIYR